ncbi:MAG: hypothetical protein AAFY71_12690 [Bacteroidota bacterium]
MFKKTLIPALMLLFALQGCFYDNKDDLMEEMNTENNNGNGNNNPSGCDTDSITYSAFVQPLISSTCQGCHNQNNRSGGVRLDAHVFVQAVAKSGQLAGVLQANGGFSQMPPSRKLDDCTISQVISWIDAGAEDN